MSLIEVKIRYKRGEPIQDTLEVGQVITSDDDRRLEPYRDGKTQYGVTNRGFSSRVTFNDGGKAGLFFGSKSSVNKDPFVPGVESITTVELP